MSVTLQQIQKLPKLELHVHFEGAIDHGRIAELARKSQTAIDRSIAEKMKLTSLHDCPATLSWATGLLQAPEQVSACAYALAEALTRDGIVYAEVTVTPSLWGPHWNPIELLRAVGAGFQAAADEKLAECFIVPALLYTDDCDNAQKLVQELAIEGLPRIVGLGIWGEISDPDQVKGFAGAFSTAREAAFGLSAHIDGGNPHTAKQIIECLKPKRLESVESIASDARLVSSLAEHCRPCSVCLTAAEALGVVEKAKNPFARLIKEGIPVYLGTDFPTSVGTSLSVELHYAAEHCGWDYARVKACMQRAIDAAFCPEKEKGRMAFNIEGFNPD